MTDVWNANMNEYEYSWMVKFYKVMQQQFWGEMVGFSPTDSVVRLRMGQ